VVRTIFSFLTGMVLSRHLEGRLPRVSRWALAAYAGGRAAVAAADGLGRFGSIWPLS
jgi:hypothetical protein